MLDLDAVDLDELSDALSSHFDELSWWLDPASGEIRTHDPDVADETADDLDGAGLIRIDPVGSRDAYRDMADFVDRLPDARAADLLSRAIAGRGAFRRFKDTLSEFPELRQRWFAFENARTRRRAIGWLADHELISDEAAERGLAQHCDPPVQPPPPAPATSAVRVERDGPVATVVLSRPEARNAVDGPTAAALAEALRSVDADPEVAVVVLWGEGGTFCAGADLKAVGTEHGNRVARDGDGPMGPTRLTMSKPVIAAVSGHAVAGGLELALWADLRVVEADAVLGVFCRRWGVPLIDGGTVRLPRLIGESRAMDLILSGRPVDADEAYRIGLANRVVEPGQARAAAVALASQLAALPQTCLRHDRASVREQHGLAESDAMANELAHGEVSLTEVADGLARFRAGAGRHGSADSG